MILKNRVKDIIILVLVILLLISFGIINSFNNKKETIVNKEVIGKVIVSDKAYVIIETANDDYYVQNIKGNYQIGDEVKFNYFSNELEKIDGIKNIKINDEEIIEVNYPNILENNISAEEKENIKKDNEIDKVIDIKEYDNYVIDFVNKKENLDISLTESNILKEESIDNKVLKYFEDLKENINTQDLKISIKNKFVTAVDFVFYDGKINSYTFNELSESAKLKVLSVLLYLDNKIENYFPEYKESISDNTSKVYTNLKERVVTSYLKITTTICEKDSSLCIEAKSNFNELKTKFNLTWKLLKSIASDGINNLKNWYEIWREK